MYIYFETKIKIKDNKYFWLLNKINLVNRRRLLTAIEFFDSLLNNSKTLPRYQNVQNNNSKKAIYQAKHTKKNQNYKNLNYR